MGPAGGLSTQTRLTTMHPLASITSTPIIALSIVGHGSRDDVVETARESGMANSRRRPPQWGQGGSGGSAATPCHAAALTADDPEAVRFLEILTRSLLVRVATLPHLLSLNNTRVAPAFRAARTPDQAASPPGSGSRAARLPWPRFAMLLPSAT